MTETKFVVDPQKPRNTFNLNGMWEVTGGERDSLPELFGSIVPVPALVDAATPQYNWQQHNYHWYRKKISVRRTDVDSSFFLKIEQSMFGTDVWLNGHHLGGSISCYTSHEYCLNDALRFDSPNELCVRVGVKSTLPPESAVGQDLEKDSFVPGIWGDVTLYSCKKARVKLVQIIPHVESATAEVRATVEKLGDVRKKLTVAVQVIEKQSRSVVSQRHINSVEVQPSAVERVILSIPISDVKLWSPDSPFLYIAEIQIGEGDTLHDETSVVFGMRNFSIVGPDFYLNGKKIFLRGSNIAFHRFLSDRQRNLLPWDMKWIKKVFIDIPKAHNFNFFRNHLGQMYNRWYDIADEYGMLLQNEWQFWGTTGSKQQITKEFTEWLQDNWNHPSIVLWDPINESKDDVVKYEIIPEMKKLDPTRAWESADFTEDHPYIYSLGMVLNDRNFGFTRSLDAIEHSATPSVVNEFVWWWLDSEGKPTPLMEGIIERWLGRNYSRQDLFEHQSFLAAELVELFRRMRVRAIQPFPYLSTSDGATAHWFLGDVAHLKPMPILSALKNSFAPFGISMELCDRHFFVDEKRTIRIFIFNDTPAPKVGSVIVGCCDVQGNFLSKQTFDVTVEASGMCVQAVRLELPNRAGSYALNAELREQDNVSAVSTRPAHVFSPIEIPTSLETSTIAVLDPSEEISSYLRQNNIPYKEFSSSSMRDVSMLVVHGNVCAHPLYQSRRDEITAFVQTGGILILIEPEYQIIGKKDVEVVDGIHIAVEQRADIDKGGYDSYLFAEDHSHPLWDGLAKEHLRMFNGAFGGEVVSQYNVTPVRRTLAEGGPNVPSSVLARCGIGLKIPAITEMKFGDGKIVISRLQIRGRLVHSADEENLFARRVDPVVQQFFVNLLAAYSR